MMLGLLELCRPGQRRQPLSDKAAGSRRTSRLRVPVFSVSARVLSPEWSEPRDQLRGRVAVARATDTDDRILTEDEMGAR